jgi:hypothetical protein
MTSQPPAVPGLAVPTISPFCAFHSASPSTRHPVSADPVKLPSGLKFRGPAPERPAAITTIATASSTAESPCIHLFIFFMPQYLCDRGWQHIVSCRHP